MSVLGAIARTLGLRGNHQASRAVLDAAFDGIIVLKASGVVVDLNAAAERMFGYPRDKAIGQPLASLVVPPDRSEPQRLALQQYDPARPASIAGHRVELEAARSDGTRVPVELSVARMDDADGVLFWCWIRDLTDRGMTGDGARQSDMEQRQSLKMEAIGRLAGGVAHDFNNVLTAIFGYADLLLDGFDANHPSRGDVLEIKKAAERAANLTRQLLAFSRKQVLQARPVDLNDVVNNMAPLLSRLVGEDIQLTITLAPDLDVVHVDPGQIDQVLMNLAANARDAMPEGGRLSIVTSNQNVSAERASRQDGAGSGRYVRLEVIDTGHGIPKDVIRHIFEPFFTTKEQGKGTGLGLATVYGIVKQSNGWIDASSELGEGTTFAIHLPSVAPRAEATSSL